MNKHLIVGVIAMTALMAIGITIQAVQSTVSLSKGDLDVIEQRTPGKARAFVCMCPS